EVGTERKEKALAAQLIDPSGPLPDDVENLLKLVEIKQLCRVAGVARIDAGPKGALISFHPSTKININKLVQYISKHPGNVKLRPEDQKLVLVKAWDDLAQRLRGTHRALT